MFGAKSHIVLRTIAIQCIVLFSGLYNTFGMQASGGIEAYFVKNNTPLESNEVASNIFRIKNPTNNTVRFHLNYSIPAGWAVLGESEKAIELNAGDSLFVPIRVIPDRQIRGGTSYIISVTLSNERSIQFATENWYLSLQAKSKWFAQLPVKNQFFINNNDSTGFSFYMRNDGNSDEEIRITLIPDRRLEILRQSDGGSQVLSFTIPLPAGTDTTILFPVLRKSSQKQNQGIDADLKTNSSKESYSVQVIAKSTKSNGSWSGTMQFLKTGDVAKYFDHGKSTVPLTLEANVYDVLSNGTTMSFDAYGNTTLAGNRLLNYRFQTVFITNYLNENSFLGNNHYLGYFDDKSSLELGEVNGWGRGMLTGRGIKGSYRYGINTFGAILTRSPGFFKNVSNEGYGLYHSMKWKKLIWNNNYSNNRNKNIDHGNDSYNSLASYKINNYNQIAAGGGYSTDRAAGRKSEGYGYELSYSGSYKKYSLAVGNSYGSSEYIMARGVNMYSSRTTYSLNHKNSFALSTQNFTQRPSYYVNNILTAGNYIRSDRYELRWGINSRNSTVALKPAFYWQENPTLRVATRLFGLEYNSKNMSGVKFSSMGSLGYAKAVDYTVPDFFVSRFSSNVRWEKFYVSLRYTYGPTQLAEQLRFIKDKINPQSIYLISSYDYWMMGDKLLMSTTGNILYETYFKKINFRLRPELYYYSNSNIRFSFYASFYTTKQGANPLIDDVIGREPFEKISNTEMTVGIGIRKQFGIPVPGKKFVTLKAIIFKDINGNRKQDQNEEGVENILVNIQSKNAAGDSLSNNSSIGEDVISNQKGEIVYENIPAGIYKLKCVSLTPDAEWFDAGNHEYYVKSKDVIYIPLTRGVRLTGSVLIERDKYSTSTPELDLSRVRVTALDSSGKTYSVLTDTKGGFVINLPSGQYMLTINESALGNKFIILQNKINIDLTKNYQNFSVTFNAVERKRKMEIKKFKNKSEN